MLSQYDTCPYAYTARPAWHRQLCPSANYSITLRQMSPDALHLIIGAALAVCGGMVGELWKESRANRREVHLLYAEIEALVHLCDVFLQSLPELSISYYLPQWRSFAVQGAATNRAWLRVLRDRETSECVIQLYLMVSSLAASFDEFVARENVSKVENDREGFYRWVAEHRKITNDGLTLLRRHAQTALERLETIRNSPLLLT